MMITCVFKSPSGKHPLISSQGNELDSQIYVLRTKFWSYVPIPVKVASFFQALYLFQSWITQ